MDPAERQARSDATLALAQEMFNRPRTTGKPGPAPATPQERGLEKIHDGHAREAVEGDTALNHDTEEFGS